jgi:acyl carrier protein
VLQNAVSLQNGIEALQDDADLHAAGLTSHATVNLMLALEETFDIEFPDHLLRRRTFASVDAIAEALAEIGVRDEAA